MKVPNKGGDHLHRLTKAQLRRRKIISRVLPSTSRGFGLMKAVTIENDFSNQGFEAIADSANLNQYKESLYMFIGVNMIARNVSGVPFYLYKIKGTKGDYDEVFDHEVIDALENPNPRQTRKEFWELTVMFYLLAGDAFWYLERKSPGAKKIVGMHALRPDYVEIVLSDDSRTIVAYEYRSGNGSKITMAPEDILHFKNPDPTNSLRGVGVVRPASSRIITEREASAYQAKFFQNQGRPDVAVFVDTELTSTDAEEARKKWREVYGHGNGGQAGFFGNDVKSITPLNTTPKEMDFIQSQNFLRDDILASLGIPKAMVTSDDVNLANAKVAKVVFLENAVVPVLEMFVDVLNNKFLPNIDDALFFQFDNPVPEDRDQLVKEITAFTGKVITQNEARDMIGFEPVDGADTLAPVSFGPAQISVQNSARRILKARPILRKRLIAVEAIAQALVEAEKYTEPKREMNPLFDTKEAKESYAKAYHKNVDQKAKSTLEVVENYFDGMYTRIIERNASGFAVDGFMDLVEEKIEAKRVIGGHLKSVYVATGQATLDSFFKTKKAGIGDGEEFVFTEAQQSAYDQRASYFAGAIVDTAFEKVKSTITEGISAGDGVDKIGRALRVEFDDMKVWKGKQIARTETNFAMSMATNDAYGQSTVVTGKEWITSGDGKVRDEHVMNAGVIVDKNGVFPNGERYPAEHSVNCRCVLAPAV